MFNVAATSFGVLISIMLRKIEFMLGVFSQTKIINTTYGDICTYHRVEQIAGNELLHQVLL